MYYKKIALQTRKEGTLLLFAEQFHPIAVLYHILVQRTSHLDDFLAHPGCDFHLRQLHVSGTLYKKTLNMWYTTCEVNKMSLQKLPPIEKIPEAFSVLADQRIQMFEDHATIVSSNFTKQYTVLFTADRYASNDAATYWQGYPGYPIIAVWMKQGYLPVLKQILPYFKGIDWHALNQKHKRNYRNACAELYETLKKQGINTEEIQEHIQQLYAIMSQFSFIIQRNPKKPEKL